MDTDHLQLEWGARSVRSWYCICSRGWLHRRSQGIRDVPVDSLFCCENVS